MIGENRYQLKKTREENFFLSQKSIKKKGKKKEKRKKEKKKENHVHNSIVVYY